MELTDITKSNQNLKRNVKDTKLALVFHVKEDGKNYEFGINTIRRKHFSVRCKSCDCHKMIPTPGIQVEETTKGSTKKHYFISADVSEEDLLDLRNYGQPVHEHTYRCLRKCTAEHKEDCSVHTYKHVQRRFRTAVVRNAIQV